MAAKNNRHEQIITDTHSPDYRGQLWYICKHKYAYSQREKSIPSVNAVMQICTPTIPPILSRKYKLIHSMWICQLCWRKTQNGVKYCCQCLQERPFLPLLTAMWLKHKVDSSCGTVSTSWPHTWIERPSKDKKHSQWLEAMNQYVSAPGGLPFSLASSHSLSAPAFPVPTRSTIIGR